MSSTAAKVSANNGQNGVNDGVVQVAGAPNAAPTDGNMRTGSIADTRNNMLAGDNIPPMNHGPPRRVVIRRLEKPFEKWVKPFFKWLFIFTSFIVFFASGFVVGVESGIRIEQSKVKVAFGCNMNASSHHFCHRFPHVINAAIDTFKSRTDTLAKMDAFMKEVQDIARATENMLLSMIELNAAVAKENDTMTRVFLPRTKVDTAVNQAMGNGSLHQWMEA